MARKIPVNFYLTPDEKNWLDVQAAKERRTRTTLLSEAIALLRASREPAPAVPAKRTVRA